jgi:hypothetical protein
MLKGEDRLKEKIADDLSAKPGRHIRSALDKIADAVRFTLVYPPERYADGVLGDVDRLKAEGFELVKLKNPWHAEQDRTIYYAIRDEDGSRTQPAGVLRRTERDGGKLDEVFPGH